MWQLPIAALGWLGRRGTAAVAASLVIGMALPSWSQYARPWLSEAVFLLLTLAFMRVDALSLRERIKRPRLFVAASFWIMLTLPLLAVIGIKAFGLNDIGPDIMLAIFIVTVAPPVMSAPAFVYLMGLDGALGLVVLVACVLLTPVSVPLMATFILDGALPISSVDLGLQLLILLGGAFLTATVIRRLGGTERIHRYSSEIDGLNVLVLFFFAVAAMDNVAATFAAKPLFTAGIAGLTFVVAFLQIGLTLLAFLPASRADAFVIAHSAGNRNLGLMVAAFSGAVPEFTWLWFALAQLPIYLLPMLLKTVAQRYSGQSGGKTV